MSVTKLPHKRGGGTSKMDCVIITQPMITDWLEERNRAPFQRPVQDTPRVKELSGDIKADGGIIDGVLTFGTLNGGSRLFVIDGQHRLRSAQLSGLEEFIADARIIDFPDMMSMGEEFVLLSTPLRRMQPDDILRALEGSMPTLKKLRAECPFIHYGTVRNSNTAGTTLSMSPTLRCWTIAQTESPSSSGASKAGLEIAKAIDANSMDKLIHFMKIARAAWGDDYEYRRLWSNLNLTICMWLWMRITNEPAHQKRHVKFSDAQFQKALMSLSASSQYLDWLAGRLMNDRDRNPCYRYVKKLITARFKEDAPGLEVKFPSAPWVSK